MREIEFYECVDGQKPIFDFLEGLPRKHKAKAIWEIELLSEKGRELKEPYTKHITNELWELRIQFNHDISRIFYYIVSEAKIILLHGFIKKTRRTPFAEIKIAEKRLSDYKARNRNEF